LRKGERTAVAKLNEKFRRGCNGAKKIMRVKNI
jgi:hypothetical protein